MKYQAINSSLFIENRKKFTKHLTQNALAVFNANDLMPTNADGLMTFRQNNDLLYLSGIDQEETILLLFPDCPEEKYREILFLRETNEHIAVWEGHKFTKEEAREASGIQSVYWTSEFNTLFNTLVGLCSAVYLNSNEHDRALVEVETRDARFIKWCMQKYPLHRYERSAPIMQYLRAVKSDIEIDLIRTACGITEMGFRRVLNFVKPGVTEYEIEAEYIHEFIRSRSKGFAYTPIIASGPNACVLHYIENNRTCKDGDLLLMDVAAEYANYASDMTRTIPVNGRFTPRQKAVYEAVLRVMKAAKGMLVVGNLWFDYHKAVGEVMEKELVNLGLITMDEIKNQDPDKPAYKKYFMHGTSHHLGLDVHDLGHKYRKFENGMVFTCEPGIYIPEEGLGVRLENNVVIQEQACIDLMATIPLEVEEIEDLMNR